jgi:phage terminase small subunit
MTLTAKQAMFVAEYLIDLNATQAAKRAGYSAKTAHVIGPENLGKPAIAAEVAKAQAERSARTNIDIDWVIKKLAKEAKRESKGSSHSARVSALGQLRQHFVGIGSEGDDAPSLSITLTAAAPVGEIRVTRHKA